MAERSEFTTDDNHRISVTEDPKGVWCCVVDGHSVHAPTRDEALFYGGWWEGRRSLADAVATLADLGTGARVVTKYDEEESDG